MNRYQKFRKDQLYLVDKDGKQIKVPPYVSNAISRYRYDIDEMILEKQCYKCKEWYKVEKLENRVWKDVHDEQEYHHVDSGYGSYCKKCEQQKPGKKRAGRKKINSSEPFEKCTVFLVKRHQIFLKVRAAQEQKTMKTLLYEILEKEFANSF